MKVILLKKVRGLGNPGDVKDVSDGYAVNFLLPQKLAVTGTDKNIAELKNKKEQLAKQAETGLAQAEKTADALGGVVIEISGKSNEEGKLYAAVTPTAIAKKLQEKGFEVKPIQINSAAPIKEVGEHSVSISFDHGLEAEITVIVNETLKQ